MKSLRQKQIDEIINEDQNINRQVVNNIYKYVKASDEVIPEQKVNQAVDSSQFFFKIDKFADRLIDVIDYLNFDKLKDINSEIPIYNSIMNSRKFILDQNIQMKNIIDSKLQELLPYLNSVVIGFDNLIQSYLLKNLSDETSELSSTSNSTPTSTSTSASTTNSTSISTSTSTSTYSEHKKSSKNKYSKIELVRMVTIYSLFLLMRNNINEGKYRPIDLSEINVEYNKLVKTFNPKIRAYILEGANNAYSGYRQQENKEILSEEIKKLSHELGRKITPQEELLLGLRIGGYKQYQPVLTNEEYQELNKKPFSEDITTSHLYDNHSSNDENQMVDELRNRSDDSTQSNAYNNQLNDDFGEELFYRDDRNIPNAPF